MKEVEILQHRVGDVLKLGVLCADHAPGARFDSWIQLGAEHQDPKSIEVAKTSLRQAYLDHRGQVH